MKFGREVGAVISSDAFHRGRSAAISWFRTTLHKFASRGRSALLSGHLLSTVSHTDDDVMVIAHARPLKAAPLEALSHARVTIARTRHAPALTVALLAAGHPAQRVGTDEVRVPGVGPEAVGLVAAHEGVVLTGLTERRDFEAVFRDMTGENRRRGDGS